MKEKAFTGGGLGSYVFSKAKKSAEAIVIGSNEPMNKSEDSQADEGLNVGLSRIW